MGGYEVFTRRRRHSWLISSNQIDDGTRVRTARVLALSRPVSSTRSAPRFAPDGISRTILSPHAAMRDAVTTASAQGDRNDRTERKDLAKGISVRQALCGRDRTHIRLTLSRSQANVFLRHNNASAHRETTSRERRPKSVSATPRRTTPKRQDRNRQHFNNTTINAFKERDKPSEKVTRTPGNVRRSV